MRLRFRFRVLVAVILFVAISSFVPRWWCGRDGRRWYAGEPALVLAHAREVAAIVRTGVSPGDFTAQGDLFKHEWQFGTYQMSALALLQVCLAHPELRAEFLPAAELAIENLLSDRIRAFDAAKWGEDPLATLETSERGHAAYLGYLNVVLSLHRVVVPGSTHAELNDRISAALERRLQGSRAGILETYPHEAYPVDNATVLGSLLLRARVVGVEPSAALVAMRERYRRDWRDPASGLLYQAMDSRDGATADVARASGTALAAYFLSFGDRELARELYEATRDHCFESWLGFGMINEYPAKAGSGEGRGDIDSGPLLFGLSPSATGFLMSSARMFGDRDKFVGFYRTAHLVGAPVVQHGDRRGFVSGGPLGNAILLAMFTALPEAP